MIARDAHDTLAPEFTLRVNGSPLPNQAAADVVALSILDDVDAAGMFAITLVAWDSAQMKAKWVDDALFEPGHGVEIEFGYRDRTVALLSGEITGLDVDFPEKRPPTVTVRGYDRRHRLMRSRRTRSFVALKDSEIAARIASEANLAPQVEDSHVQLPYVLQHNQTDLDFLTSRARRIGFELVVADRDLIFRPRATTRSPALTLHREVELIEFAPRMTTMGQVPALEVRGWDPREKREIVGHAGANDVPDRMGGERDGPAATARAFAPPPSARVTSPVQSQEEADLIATRNLASIALDYVHADGVCIGDPRLRAGTIVAVEGVGRRFGGPYYLTSVEHSFRPGKGYRTRFSAKRNAS